MWRYAGQHGFTRCPAVGDLDGDGFAGVHAIADRNWNDIQAIRAGMARLPAILTKGGS